jgi:hypothetical protein
VGKTSLSDKARSQRPVRAKEECHQECILEMIQENCQIKHKDTTLKLGISKERVGHIISLVGF